MRRKQLEQVHHRMLTLLGALWQGLKRPGQRQPLQDYMTGLLLNGQRKNIDAMARRLVKDPEEQSAVRQQLQHFITHSDWDDGMVRRELARYVEDKLSDIKAFMLDDTGFAKKGKHSVGVARQYSGTLARVGNCQVMTSLHVASENNSAAIDARLYLPSGWTELPERLKKARVPEEIGFQKKWQIALDLLDNATGWDLPRYPVLADAGYGDCSEFRQGLDERGFEYGVGVSESTRVWLAGTGPEVADTEGDGRISCKSVPALELAKARGKRALRPVTWRQGTKGKQKSRFGTVRVHPASNGTKGPEQWLLYEWPSREAKPTKFWLSTLPPDASKRELVRMVKLRWRIERDYQDMKQEVGLDEFQGRSWPGFHHHVTLCMAAHAFLALERAFSPR